MNKRDILDKTVLNSFSYHDGEITSFEKDGNDYVLTFTDGWNEGQVNEIRMVNVDVVNKYELNDRVIYQLGFIDYIEFSPKKCYLEIYVWYDDSLTEVVKFYAEDFISKCYLDGKMLKEERFSSLFNK